MSRNTKLEREELLRLESLLSKPAFKTLTPIDEAIKVYRDVSWLSIISKSDNKKINGILRDLLFQRYQEQHSLEDLENAVLASKRVLGFEEDGRSEKDIEHLETLGILLYNRILRQAEVFDIEKSVRICRIVVDNTPSDDPRRAARLDRLACCLHARFRYSGDSASLDECISISAGAIVIPRVGDDARIAYLHNLTLRLLSRLEKFVQPGDLERAEKLTAEALSSMKEGHPFRPELLSNRSRVLFARFKRSHFWRDLDEATTLATEAIQVKTMDPLKLVVRNQNLSVFCLQSFQVNKKPAELRLAYKYATAAVHGSKELKLVRDVARETLLAYFQVVFIQSGKISDLQNILDLLQEQTDDLSDEALKQTKREQYTKLLCLKYQHTEDHLDLVFLCYEALQKLQADEAKGVGAEEVAESGRKMNALTYLFGELYRLLLVPEYIDVRDALMKAIHAAFLQYAEEEIPSALTSFLKKHQVFSIRLDVYGRNAMEDRESIIGGSSQSHLTDRTGIIEQARTKARTSEDPVPLSQFRFRMIDRHLTFRPEKNVDLADARRAVLQLTSSVSTSTEAKSVPSGKEYLQLSKALFSRFEENRKKGDKDSLSILEEAIDSAKKSVNSVGIGSKEYTDSINHHVMLCLRKTDIDGSKEIMGETIKVVEDALTVTGNKSLFLKLNLCQLLRSRFLRFQDITDLNKASTLADEFADPTKVGQGYGFDKVVIAAAVLKGRYQWLGDSAALDKGISVLRQAVGKKSWDKESPRVENLINAKTTLGIMLRLRFRRTGTFQDILDASNFGRSALGQLKKSGLPTGFANGIKNNVAIVLEDLFMRTKKPEDLEEAISVIEEIGDVLGNINLANMLHERFHISGNPKDLDQAARIAKKAVADKRNQGAHHVFLLSDSAEILLAKYKQSHEMEYLDEAMKLEESSLSQISKGNPWRANILLVYGEMLYQKSMSAGGTTSTARRRCIEAHEEAWENQYGAPASRIKAAHQAAKLHCLEKDWVTASKLFEDAVEYISEVCPLWMDHKDRQHLLGDLSELPSNAATVALKAGKDPYQALRLLELSRSVIMGSTIDIRGDISHLAELDPELEHKFNRVRMALDSSSDDGKGFSGGSKYFDDDFLAYGKQMKTHDAAETTGVLRQKELFKEMASIIASIRQIPGLDDFLKPPSPEAVVKLAREGPIVYVLCSKVTSIGSAIVATSIGVEAINLPGFAALETIERLSRMKTDLTSGPLRTYAARNKGFSKELLWLWEAVVKPVLACIDPNFESLATTQKTRVHWIGVGTFSCVPFHAAGDHSPGSTSNSMSHLISSYASSLRALQYVKAKSPGVDLRDRLLITTMGETPGAARLPSVGEEMLSIKSIINEALPMVSLEKPNPSQVLEQLPHHNLVHFACHGVSDPVDPFKSRLLLANPNKYRASTDQTPGTLSVHDLLTHRSPRADLAYISACSTADIKVATLTDESIHIASGFQLAGFRHVVASLWSQKDGICLEMAAEFYRELIRLKGESTATSRDDWAVAEALHNAVVKVRSNRPEMPLQWASFVHIGW